MKFVVASEDYSGLGFAMRLQDEGHEVILALNPRLEVSSDPKAWGHYQLIGEGLVRKGSLKSVIQDRGQWKDAYFIWDENHSVEENKLLREDGFKVFGGGAFADRMEHDRDAAIAFAAKHGLNSPPSCLFDDPEDAIHFAESRPNIAYVFKPDKGESFETWVPESPSRGEANQQLRAHLRSLTKNGRFILQERKEGIEFATEVWFVRGEPRFALVLLECKKKLAGDLGEFSGCALDYVFAVPLDCKAIRESMGKLFPAYEAMGYTGIGDANLIAASDGLWFLEKCERFGYNCHANLFWTLNRDPLGKTFASLADGVFRPNFRKGFGASVRFYVDHPAPRQAIQFPEESYKNLFLWDAYKKDGVYATSGWDHNILIAAAYGRTMPSAWKRLMAVAETVRFQNCSYRNDGARTDFAASPLKRYQALVSLGFLSVESCHAHRGLQFASPAFA